MALFEGTGQDLAQRLPGEEARALYAAAANRPESSSETRLEAVEKRIARTKKDSLEAQRDRVQRDLLAAQDDRDDARAMKLLTQKRELTRLMESVGAT